MFRRTGFVVATGSLVLLAGAALSAVALPAASAAGQSVAVAPAAPDAGATPAASPATAIAPAQRQTPTIAQTLESGVLIVVSKASQQMHVFKDGQAWLSSPVSTGRRGHRTPAGVFPVLEKRRFHRSNLYSNAPMPFMQRLTRGGIAIHAGHLPGYPASHGCIRLPAAVARSLFGLTQPGTTLVVIRNESMANAEQARSLALVTQPPKPAQAPPVELAYARVNLANDPRPAAPARHLAEAQAAPGIRQTIQLTAALSPQEAEAHWSRLLSTQAGLGRYDKSVEPVALGSRRYFRLRATGPNAFSYCSQLKGAGFDCFRVR